MDVFHEKDLMRTYLHISHQAFVPELELAAGVGFDGDVAFNQVTGEFSTFSAGLMDTANSTLSQRTFLAHFAFKPLLAVAALAGHF